MSLNIIAGLIKCTKDHSLRPLVEEKLVFDYPFLTWNFADVLLVNGAGLVPSTPGADPPHSWRTEVGGSGELLVTTVPSPRQAQPSGGGELSSICLQAHACLAFLAESRGDLTLCTAYTIIPFVSQM